MKRPKREEAGVPIQVSHASVLAALRSSPVMAGFKKIAEKAGEQTRRRGSQGPRLAPDSRPLPEVGNASFSYSLGLSNLLLPLAPLTPKPSSGPDASCLVGESCSPSQTGNGIIPPVPETSSETLRQVPEAKDPVVSGAEAVEPC